MASSAKLQRTRNGEQTWGLFRLLSTWIGVEDFVSCVDFDIEEMNSRIEQHRWFHANRKERAKAIQLGFADGRDIDAPCEKGICKGPVKWRLSQ